MNAYKTHHDTLEIFSGDLLAKRSNWQPMKEGLAGHTYLLVTPLDNPVQTRLMLKLGRTLRGAGVSVFVLSVG
jgi:hypothetical protein